MLKDSMMENHKMTVIDRVMLFGKKVECAKKLNDSITIFAVSSPNPCLYYKFKYAGNTQYHRIDYDLIDEFSKLNTAMKSLLSGGVGNGQ
jgi:hypothetical protein